MRGSGPRYYKRSRTHDPMSMMAMTMRSFASAGRQPCAKSGRLTDEAYLGAIYARRSRNYLQSH